MEGEGLGGIVKLFPLFIFWFIFNFFFS